MMMMMMVTGIFTYGTNTYRYSFRRYSVRTPSWWSRWSCLISDVFYSTNSQCNHLFSPRFPFNCFQGHTVGAPVILAVAAVCVGNTIVLFPGSSTHSPLFFSKSRFVHKSPWGSLHLILIKKRTSIISCATKINEKKIPSKKWITIKKLVLG